MRLLYVLSKFFLVILREYNLETKNALNWSSTRLLIFAENFFNFLRQLMLFPRTQRSYHDFLQILFFRLIVYPVC